MSRQAFGMPIIVTMLPCWRKRTPYTHQGVPAQASSSSSSFHSFKSSPAATSDSTSSKVPSCASCSETILQKLSVAQGGGSKQALHRSTCCQSNNASGCICFFHLNSVTHTHTYNRIHTHTYTRAHTHSRTCTHMRARTHTHTQTYTSSTRSCSSKHPLTWCCVTSDSARDTLSMRGTPDR